ncbi:MAG TPA: molybdopterin-dependent oxidoreductase [Syntrophomonadaceae bacterium]|nr:molybdopterin-dependent oxidoreductase [Syntrophomonadaceae bacterium]
MEKNRTIVETNCSFCGYQCALLATVEAGRVIKVQPDNKRFPYNNEIMKGCKRWPMIMEVMDHPQRINYPLKRIGERGSGRWQRINWEQALSEIADKLGKLKEEFGPETLATSIGAPHTTYWPLHRFMSLFGSPNNMGIGQICWNPGIWVNTLTYGWPIGMELSHDYTEAAMLWGINPAESDNSLFWDTIQKYKRQGKPLIVVDPRYTKTAEQATLWLGLKPGTDPVLVLGLIHVIIKENIYHHQFVEKWCHGFDKLVEHIVPYTPTYVEGITGVNADKISRAARLFAENSPGCIYNGRGIDQLGTNTFPTHRGLAILRAITGNVDVPGASHLAEMPDYIPELDLELSDAFTTTEPVSISPKLLLQSYQGYAKTRELTMKHNKRLPMRYLTSAHPEKVWQAMITGNPYPIRSLIVMGSNPLLTQANTKLVYQALKELDLLVVLELVETPTAMLADYVLPSAGVLEVPLIETNAGITNIAYGGKQAVEPYYERRPDYYFWRELGIRLGQEEKWPWKNYEDALAGSLDPLGINWEKFCETGLYFQENSYYKHEKTNEKGVPIGFATVSGKIELYSEFLKEIDADPLPQPKSLLSDDNYPLTLITGARYHPYYASSYHQIAYFRRLHPEPIVEMSEKTASSLSLLEGDKIYLETKNGRALFQTKITSMVDQVVSVEYGWWHPELEAYEPELGGIWRSNANLLTAGEDESSDHNLIGTWTYNGIPCRAVKE